jgi:hypothetical protein
MYEPSVSAQQQLYSKIMQRDKDLGGVVWLFQRKGTTGVRAWSATLQNITWNPLLYGFDFSALYIQPSGSTAQMVQAPQIVQTPSPNIASRNNAFRRSD